MRRLLAALWAAIAATTRGPDAERATIIAEQRYAFVRTHPLHHPAAWSGLN